MNKIEIKKALYRQKPFAKLTHIKGKTAFYYARLDSSVARFQVPVDDMGDADFLPEMDAKLLIRWLTV